MAQELKKAYVAPGIRLIELMSRERLTNDLSTEEESDTPQLYSTSDGWGPWV